MTSKGRNRDMTKYFHFHEDFDHETNSCRDLKKQIEEAVKTGQLAHLVKGIKKGKEKISDTQLGKDTTPQEAPILMARQGEPNLKRKATERDLHKVGEVTFPSEVGRYPSNDPVVIKVIISNLEVNKVYMDYRSSCEVIYEHCFMKLQPSIRSKRVEPRIPLVGFSGERSWPLGEVPLEVIFGEGSFTRTETLTLLRSKSPYNLLIGRTAMQKMGMVVSTVHSAVKFQTEHGIRTILSSHNEGVTKSSKRGVEEGPCISTK